jgi:hypothetical protein
VALESPGAEPDVRVVMDRVMELPGITAPTTEPAQGRRLSLSVLAVVMEIAVVSMVSGEYTLIGDCSLLTLIADLMQHIVVRAVSKLGVTVQGVVLHLHLHPLLLLLMDLPHRMVHAVVRTGILGKLNLL